MQRQKKQSSSKKQNLTSTPVNSKASNTSRSKKNDDLAHLAACMVGGPGICLDCY